MADKLKDDHLKKRIIIIGAGAAGLSAAMQLKEMGFYCVTILEATNQVGGRISTFKYESNALEMGAQWIHGEVENAVYSLAEKNNLVNKSAPNYMHCIFQLSNIKLAEDKAIISNAIAFLHREMDAISENCAQAKNYKNSTDIQSLHSYLCQRFLRHILEKDNRHVQQLKQSTLQWFLNLQRELNGCENLETVSLKLLNNYKDCDGLQTVELKNGYSSVLDIFMKEIPSTWIVLNKNVELINWGDNESAEITVTCEDKSTFMADHVITTISLGCLKKNANSMFNPSLPEKKLHAIERTGYGTVNKVYLKFEDPFWKIGDIFNVFWTPDLEEYCKKIEKSRTCQQLWYKDINRFAYVLNQPKFLCAWITGVGASFMESLSNDHIIHDCHFLLKTILQMKDLPLPTVMMRSLWYSNKFFRGSYSHLTVVNELDGFGFEDLAEPIFQFSELGKFPALLFAGEATHPYFYSTVHGAVDSGIREAKRIYAHYEQFQLLKVPNPLVKKVKVIIIGAGVAGLTCAQQLVKSGFNDIIVLEALDRVGGRIWTVNFENAILELGAQWVHGEQNMLFEYCSKVNLLETVECSYEGKGLFCTSDGESISQCLMSEMFEIMDKIKEKIDTCNSCLNQSVEDAYERFFEEYLICCTDAPDVMKWKKGVFNWFKRFEIIDNACDNLHDLSILSYKNWVDCPGLYHTDFKNGFHSFIQHVVNTLPLGIIKNSKPVKCIYWRKNIFQTAHYKMLNKWPFSECPVIVECEDGEYFAAQTVVVTSSVGFLNANMDSFFQPKLPVIKANTLAKVGFGTVNKIFLVYKKRFWNPDDQGFQLVWTTENINKQRYSPEESWVFGITGFDRVRNLPNVLLAWVGGLQAKQMEKIDPISVGKTCTQILRQFLNNPKIPFPIQVIRSSWYENPYIRGSYSNRPGLFFDAGCNIKDLQEPLYCNFTLRNGTVVQWPAVTFAGEAFDMKYFSSVHGAMQSGASESYRILQFYRDLKNL